MFHRLQDLLPEALRRGRLARSMEAVSAVEIFNEAIATFLPAGRANDAQAVSFKNNILFVNCRNGSASHWISNHEFDLISVLVQKKPELQIKKIIARISDV